MYSYLLYEEKICKNCGQPLFLDDVDYDFKGCQNEYWVCTSCKTSLFVKVRYGKVCKKEWTNEEKRGNE